MTNIRDKQKVTSSRLEELRPHVQDSHLDHCPLTMPSHILPLDQLRPSVAAIQSPSGTLDSDTTFDTFRANYGQSRFFQYSQGEIGEQEQLQRQPTILSLLSLPSQAPEELVYLLGNRDGKLKAGATMQPRNQSPPSPISPDNATTPQKPVHMTTLERAKRRSRVALNLVLAGDTFVQGQTISGQLIVNVHNAEFPVRLANNKLRVIGFESFVDDPTFHVFFHYSCRFDEISYAGEQIFSESPDNGDEEGYREAREGIHVLPFEMTLPDGTSFGSPKGAIDVRGAAVRYIIMASVNVKDPDTDRLSLAHFYRACSIWPSLSIHDVLIPSTRPLISTAVMTLSQCGLRGKLKLSARVPRPSYFSGQYCYVNVQILNETRKTVHALRLTLTRTTTVYRPQSGKESRTDDHITRRYQSKEFVDEISESRLAMAERTTRRCASSRGWWAGVSPQERTAFTHSIMIPSDALSITRTGLLAVDHAIRVTVYASAGPIGLTSQLSVMLPIHILSMLSVDPPTSVSCPPNMRPITHTNRPDLVNGLCLHLPCGSERRADSPPPYRTRPPSLEHPQGITELRPFHPPPPNPHSTTLSDGLRMREHTSDGTSLMIAASPLGAAIAQDRPLPVQRLETQCPRTDGEEQSFHRRASGGTASERSMSNSSTQASSIANQSNSGNRIVSPIPSLRRARARALTIGGTSGYSRQEQKELEGGVRTQGLHSDEPPDEDDRWDFRNRESPFSSRVKEKLRQVHAYDEESPREPFKQAVRLPAFEQLDTLPARASYVDGDGPLHRTRPLYIRNAKSRSLMGPRERKAAAPGSVMDRVRSILSRVVGFKMATGFKIHFTNPLANAGPLKI